jgi:hypothetical protein
MVGDDRGGSWVDTAHTGKKQREYLLYFIKKVEGRMYCRRKRRVELTESKYERK